MAIFHCYVSSPEGMYETTKSTRSLPFCDDFRVSNLHFWGQFLFNDRENDDVPRGCIWCRPQSARLRRVFVGVSGHGQYPQRGETGFMTEHDALA